MQTHIKSRLPSCPEALDDVQIRQFREEGYLAFENVLSAGEVEAARAALTELTAGLLEAGPAG